MSRAGAALSAVLRRLDARLHIDHRGRSEWIWAVPALTVLGTLGLLVGVGVASGTAPALITPVALIVALVMGGMSVAYMTPESDGDSDPGDGRRPPDSRAPDTPPPTPRPWYERLAEPTVDEPAPRRRTAGRR